MSKKKKQDKLDVVDVIEKTVNSMVDQMRHVYDKDLLSRLMKSDFNKKCCKCESNLLAHSEKKNGHPFFNNNLEMLEWEDKRKHK